MYKFYLTVSFLLLSFFSFSNPVDSARLTKKEEANLVKIFNRQLDSVERKLQFQTGTITLADGRVNFRVPEDFLFIDAAQSHYILEDLWGNLPDEEVAGMVVKKGFKVSKLDNDYSFVISFSDIGYVKDNINKELDHNALLGVMKSNMDASNETREALGINTMTVTGWAMVPNYDEYKKAVYWANKIAATGSEEEILNYNLRLLGRSGVIKINAVATMDQLTSIKQVLPLIISQTRFEDGQQYSDFIETSDRISDYSINELVSGKKAETKNWLSSFIMSWKLLTIMLLSIGGLWFGFSILKRKAMPVTSVR
jgi:uncharacterized membrane-anchored protein